MQPSWNVYLAGEIHSDWRTRIEALTAEDGLAVSYTGPVTDHGASDDAGAVILGAETDPFWHDRKGANLNAIRTRTLLDRCDVVVVRFGEKYRQWNAAFDAGYAVAIGKPLVVIHPPEFNHALKEIDAAALAVASTPEQVVDILRYVVTGQLSRP